MATLWTDIIDPATLTGYARASLVDFESRRGQLARWLPNRDVADIIVRFVAGATGLIPIARFRAFDAEPEVGKRAAGQRVTLELPALGIEIPVSEYEQLRLRGGNVSDAAVLSTLQNTTDIVVRAVADAIERLRGIVLATGIATIAQNNFQSADNFGRPAGHQLTAAAPWTTAGVDRLGYLQTISDVYLAANGEAPGAIVTSTRVMRALAAGNQFLSQLIGGATRPATTQQVQDTVSGAGLPPIYIYDRQVNVNGVTTKVLPDDGLLLLPAPVEPNDWQGTQLGATFWGRTLTSTEPDWSIPDSDQPGLVVGAYKNATPPMIALVVSDAIALPVLANAALSLYADVL